jgi:DNA-binding XRE family transcriptional regulator
MSGVRVPSPTLFAHRFAENPRRLFDSVRARSGLNSVRSGLAARFKAEREGQGLTLAQVAERMGIDAPALSRLETGKMLNPTLATLHKWAEALGRKLEVDCLSA